MSFVQNDWTETLQEYAKHSGLNLRAFVGTNDATGKQEYVMFEGNDPIYASQNFEAVSVWIDMYARSLKP